MGTYIVLQIISLLISALLGFMLSKRESIRITIRDSLLGGLIGSSCMTLIILSFEIKDIVDLKDKIVSPNYLTRLEKKMEEGSVNDLLLESVKVKKQKVEESLVRMINGKVDLMDEGEVVDEWKRLFNGSATNAFALNYVTPNFWIEDSKFSSFQLKVQKDAISEGVNIKRIFIYDIEDENEIEVMKQLAKKLEDVGVRVRYYDYSKLIKKNIYLKNKPIIRGSIDFVLYDLNAVLLTFHDPETRRIVNGMISSEREQIDAAKNLFDELWTLSLKKI